MDMQSEESESIFDAFEQEREVRQSDQSVLQEMLTEQGEQIDYQQQQLDGLIQCLAEISQVLRQQREDNPRAELELLSQTLAILGKAITDLYRQAKEINIGQELSSLKSEQQALRKSNEAAHKSLSNQVEDLVTHLDWRRVAAIVFMAAIVSSICSILITQAALNNSFKEINKEPAIIKETPKAVKKKAIR